MIQKASRNARYVGREIILTVIALTFWSSGPRAQTLVWNSLGPNGGYIRVVGINFSNPQIIYAGLVEDADHPLFGVYRSPDGGITWNYLNNGIPADSGIFALTLDPSSPSTLYVGVDNYSSPGGGIYKSNDGGDSWTLLSAPAGWGYLSLAVSPINPATVYAGTDSWGLLESGDGGITWSQAIGLPGTLSVNALAIDPQNPANVYAGTTNGMFVSTDAGNSWNVVSNGLPDSANIGAIAINSFTSSVYVGLNGYGRTDGGGLFMSGDTGGTWTAVGNGLPTWCAIHTIAIDPVTPSNVYIGTFGAGAFASTDGGNTFSDFNANLGDVYVHSIAINRQMPTIIYAATCNAGVFVTQPSGGDSGGEGTIPAGASSPGISEQGGRRATFRE
jgi:hypothetical protein